MRFLSVWIVFIAIGVVLLLSGCDSKSMMNEREHSETQPYLDDSKIPHNTQWERDDWEPEDWIASKGSAKRVVDGLYAGNIITKQYEDGNDTPILEVGQGFMDLSAQDKRRVVMFVDHAFQVTSTAPDGMFYIYHQKSDEPLGLYTKQGLQLQ